MNLFRSFNTLVLQRLKLERASTYIFNKSIIRITTNERHYYYRKVLLNEANLVSLPNLISSNFQCSHFHLSSEQFLPTGTTLASM